MKRYFEEIIIFVSQLVVFFVFPLLVLNNYSNGLIVMVVLGTFMTSFGFGGVCKSRIRYYYPIIISLLFIPAVYIYNTQFILAHSLICWAASTIGVFIGNIVMNK